METAPRVNSGKKDNQKKGVTIQEASSEHTISVSQMSLDKDEAENFNLNFKK